MSSIAHAMKCEIWSQATLVGNRIKYDNNYGSSDCVISVNKSHINDVLLLT